MYAIQLCNAQHPSHFVQIRHTYFLFICPLYRNTCSGVHFRSTQKYTSSTCQAKPVILECFTACVGLLQTGELYGNVAADKDFVQTSFYVSNAQCEWNLRVPYIFNFWGRVLTWVSQLYEKFIHRHWPISVRPTCMYNKTHCSVRQPR